MDVPKVRPANKIFLCKNIFNIQKHRLLGLLHLPVITPVCLQEVTKCFHIAVGNLIQTAFVKLKKPVQPPDIIFNLVLWNSFCLLKKGWRSFLLVSMAILILILDYIL